MVLLMLGVMTAFFVPVPRMWGILAVQMALFAVAIIYSYRGQLKGRLYLLYGAGGFFLMGLALRAIHLKPT